VAFSRTARLDHIGEAAKRLGFDRSGCDNRLRLSLHRAWIGKTMATTPPPLPVTGKTLEEKKETEKEG